MTVKAVISHYLNPLFIPLSPNFFLVGNGKSLIGNRRWSGKEVYDKGEREAPVNGYQGYVVGYSKKERTHSGHSSGERLGDIDMYVSGLPVPNGIEKKIRKD